MSQPTQIEIPNQRAPEGIGVACKVEGCSRPVGRKGARGWCPRHYQRWLSTGSPTGSNRPSSESRFFAKVQQDGDCWRWMNALDQSGYGMFRDKTGPMAFRWLWRAHRWSYTFLVAEIPEGLEIDHLCRNRWCVNPWHLEPVPGRVNNKRGFSDPAKNARKTECKRGHPFTADNVYITTAGGRSCRRCLQMHRKNYELRAKGKRAA